VQCVQRKLRNFRVDTPQEKLAQKKASYKKRLFRNDVLDHATVTDNGQGV